MKVEKHVARSEERPAYLVEVRPASAQELDDDATLAKARSILESRLSAKGPKLHSPAAVKALCTLHLATLDHEQFWTMYLDAQNSLIAFEMSFVGTLTQTSVYPREIVKAALAKNAAAVIFAHSHPSGHADPSRADEHLTSTLKTTLSLVDVKVLDHIVVGGTDTVSFAERGLP